LGHSGYIVCRWTWQIMVAIRAEAKVRERVDFFVRQITHDFADFRSAKFKEICTQEVDLCRDASFRNKILKIFPQGVFFVKRQIWSENLQRLATSAGRYISEMITNRGNSRTLYRMSSFNFYRWNQLSHSHGQQTVHRERRSLTSLPDPCRLVLET